MSDTPRDCEHGRLARSCEICELKAELAAAREEIEKLRSEWRIQNDAIADLHDRLAAAHKDTERYRFYAQHYFVTPEKTDFDPFAETCRTCGMNLRDSIHTRAVIEAAKEEK